MFANRRFLYYIAIIKVRVKTLNYRNINPCDFEYEYIWRNINKSTGLAQKYIIPKCYSNNTFKNLLKNVHQAMQLLRQRVISKSVKSNCDVLFQAFVTAKKSTQSRLYHYYHAEKWEKIIVGIRKHRSSNVRLFPLENNFKVTQKYNCNLKLEAFVPD